MSRLHGSKRGPRGPWGLHPGDFLPRLKGWRERGRGRGRGRERDRGLPAGLSLQEPGVAAPQN